MKQIKNDPADSSNLTLQRMRKIVESARHGKLIVMVGAGVGMGLTNGISPSWSGLIESGFKYANRKGRISDAQLDGWGSQLSSSDMDDLLGAAEFMGRKLGAPNDQLYARWLQEEFSSVKPNNNELETALKLLVALGIPLCTLNYDPLLEIVTGLPSLQVYEINKVAAWMRREYPAILHLHGSWDNPSSCILGIRDYETTQTNEVRDLFQRNLAAFNHLLFIGCGDTLADPNFSALVGWLRKQLNAAAPEHIALVREADLEKRNIDPAWLGFVEPVSFGSRNEDLASFILKIFSHLNVEKPRTKKNTGLVESGVVIEEYRSFLIKDCGQMTIEGVSADMDTGQRKFDLERLFVPLNILACPPEFAANDPKAAEKLEEWQKKNSKAIPFGHVLASQKRLALLALPGGGKTLLLKRLAVAYAESSRRTASSDELPELDLLPVLIRCREWRDYIRWPIKTLLQRMGDITGQPNFSNLSNALTPLLKKGKVLLLVDGLDEIHNDADRATFVEHLESFLDEYKQIRLVVTSREAGFSLVAPSLSRFCERWRLAPLNDSTITLLCSHWHRLMTGDTPAAIAEGDAVAEMLLRNGSLRRLAENPLLLTMLLVVKHGAGGLPPDRVSLYGRAVDVLLDTWNIKGHDPLNAKEAVPQLAYVAFQLMCAGKQTATESELLALLEEARERHPNIKRYAKDSPHDFLKRVELRSSLLLEAGHQIENGRTVPFFQFRHLTFQEYLTAVAVTEGHYQQYSQVDTVLSPIKKYLLAEEWKEVIPMVAVLARKRAEPLLIELISLSNNIRFNKNILEQNDATLIGSGNKLGGPAGRLLQCFIEEAEASPETISSALETVAFFARGCGSPDDWEAICRGPYGEELYYQAWKLLISIRWPYTSWLMNTCASIAEYQRPVGEWVSDSGIEEINALLNDTRKDEIGRGLLICMGSIWNSLNRDGDKFIFDFIDLALIEKHLFSEDYDLSVISIWVWTNARRKKENITPVSSHTLDNLLAYWLEDDEYKRSHLVAYTLTCQLGIERESWTPLVSETQKKIIKERFERDEEIGENYSKSASFFVAYHSRVIWNDIELMEKFEFVSGTDNGIVQQDTWKYIKKEISLKIPRKINFSKNINN